MEAEYQKFVEWFKRIGGDIGYCAKTRYNITLKFKDYETN